MVFSETIPPTPSVLKVVEIDHLKQKDPLEMKLTGEKKNGLGGGVDSICTDETMQPFTSFSEEYLKPEPLFEECTMDRSTDCEFFQDLGLWCSDPAKEEPQQIIDSQRPPKYVHKVHNTDTTLIQFSPTSWELDANSPTATASMYTRSPPVTAHRPMFPELTDTKPQYRDQFLDICSMPVVIGDLADDVKLPVSEPVAYTDITTHTRHTHTQQAFIQQEDSLDMKLALGEATEVRWSDVMPGLAPPPPLALDVAAAAAAWPAEPVPISTPEVLSYVVQLEKDDQMNLMEQKFQWPTEEELAFLNTESPGASTSVMSSAPVTPAPDPAAAESDEDVSSRRRRRRRPSADSDDTYTPYAETTQRKYKKRKPNIPIKEMILALEEAQPPAKAPRGRPPKRRDSNVSSACSVEFSSENKYREIRDKNNEASKRSRMNRKLKELQMEQLAIELEERNKKLKVKADILEDMTKKLKDALMTAILKT